MKTSLLGYTLTELKFLLIALGEPSFRASQIYTALHEGLDLEEITNIPKALKAKLAENYVGQCMKIVTVQSSSTAEKYLFSTQDDKLVEGVYMRHGYGDTLCISTEIGCPMGCAFCASGKNGLDRKLSAAEMLSAVLVVNRRCGGTIKKRAVTNIVMMGMGEPLDNYDESIRFIRLVSDQDGINISPRNISLSTAGVVPGIERLSEEGLPINLTISLHAPTDELRNRIMPVNRVYPLDKLLPACWNYLEKTGRRINIEYIMIEGFNDSRECALKLAALLRGRQTHVNLINFNRVDGAPFRGVTRNAIMNFLHILEQNGVSVTTRRSLGGEIEGACGQLRNRNVK